MSWKKERSRPPRKFIQGNVLTDVFAALVAFLDDDLWFFYYRHLIHAKALRNMSLATLNSMILRGSIKSAHINPDWIAWERDRFAKLDYKIKSEILFGDSK